MRQDIVEGVWRARRASAGGRAASRAVPMPPKEGVRHQAEVVDLPVSDSPEGRTKRVVIVGGVAGGMSTATRLRRLDADVSITVIERSGHVSFANCGLPYYVGGLIEEEEDLTLQTPEQLFEI